MFGTLAVLRSSALNTGQNIVRALLGTAAGFIVGAILVTLIGTNTTVLWVLLPIAVLLAGLAPATVSFAAGQAAFTLTLLILFNILAPAGWKIGLVRIEDVALGCAVSLVVGLLFWPRGAAAALGKALSEAYVDSADYLSSAVAYGVGRCDASGPSGPKPTDESSRAARRGAAARRHVPRLSRRARREAGAPRGGDATRDRRQRAAAGRRRRDRALGSRRWRAAGADRAAARAELLERTRQLNSWYDGFAASLTRQRHRP